MGDLADGEHTEVKGSGSAVYTLKNSGGVYSCTCPAWMHQSVAIERRTCKHLRALRGDDAEKARVGSDGLSGRPVRPPGQAKTASSATAGASTDDDGPPLLLAHKWESGIDITGWWLSEKLDGVRAYWDGAQFVSRLGNKFFPPKWFTDGLPDTPLDGELWGGRKLFQRTVGIVKRQDQSPLWKDLLYVVFDAPSFPGTFEERIAHCKALVGTGAHPYARVHAHETCRGVEHLKEELARVEALGGEGLMARRPKSLYEAGRSNTLLKVKTFHDAEARVVGHVPGAGRHKGRLGALLVELADGTRFNVGTGFSDKERSHPPPVGALITFRYQELSDQGVPRFPSYVAVRDDANGPSPLASLDGFAPAAAKELSPKSAVESAASGRRRFEKQDGETRHFWEIERHGSQHKVRFGTFSAKTRKFASEAEAEAVLSARVAQRLARGFVEVDDD
jgi:DNA ligase-1